VIRIFNNLFLSKRVFWAGSGLVVLFVLSFAVDWLFPLAQTLLVILIALLFADIVFIFNSKIKMQCQHKLPKLLSLGSQNDIEIILVNQSKLNLKAQVLVELPYQVKERNIEFIKAFKAGEGHKFIYTITPTTRGKYRFGKIQLYVQTVIGLAERRIAQHVDQDVPVYPSVKAMKMLEMHSLVQISTSLGVKKIRKVGHTLEFDHIKNYVKGDDYSSINWKASSRANTLMVNHYEDEKSQQVYSLIDKSRNMLMPFNGMSLLDYAINTSLVISNTALNKYDKAGLISFSNKIGSVLKAGKNNNQLKLILEALYNEQEENLEANFELLYTVIKNSIKGRSLFFLFTNFESKFALERVLPALRKISKLHLLVVVIFENTELIEYHNSTAHNLEEIYYKTIAGRFIAEKKQIAFALKQYGIQTIITKPEDLSINTINMYFELKSRGLI
jgi:uncharacterized protein (DUF58 family)